MGKVFGIHELTLRPGVDPAEFARVAAEAGGWNLPGSEAFGRGYGRLDRLVEPRDSPVYIYTDYMAIAS